jgi:PPOX class probable F420-dependent enzyme
VAGSVLGFFRSLLGGAETGKGAAVASQEEIDRFLSEQRLGVLVTIRRDGTPQASPVAYLYEDGKIAISTVKRLAKVKNIRRDDRVTFCVVGQPPNARYVTIHGRAKVIEDEIVEPTAKIFRRVSDSPVPDDFEELLRKQGRVILTITPERFLP